MRTKKEIEKRLEEIMGYDGQMGVVDGCHLKDKNPENREKAIKSVAETEREIEVLKWVLGEEDKEEIRYMAYVTAKEFSYRSETYRNLQLKLFKNDLTEKDKQALPRIIKNYKELKRDDRAYAITVIEEYFTANEILEMKPWFEKLWEGARFSYEREVFPIETRGRMGVGATPVGGGQGFYMFDKYQDYPLNYPVWGYFDTRHFKPIRKSKRKN